MREKILNSITEDLVTIPPLLFRSMRSKMLKNALAASKFHLTPLLLEIMKLLDEKGTLQVTEIGNKLHIARPQTTRMIDKLIDLGMVERQSGTVDRRTINIALSAKGKNSLKENGIHIRQVIGEFLSELTDEDLRDLSDSLRKLRDVFFKIII